MAARSAAIRRCRQPRPADGRFGGHHQLHRRHRRAEDHVHVLFYIWLPDGSGLAMVDAVKRAAARGVTCRVMVDDLGSRTLIRSQHWADMAAAGARLARALPIGNPLSRPFKGRIDMRNHRKIVVIDGRITYCGSQNCADAAFAIKAKYAPWVDAMMRFEGPVVRQNQHLFASDWMACVNEDLSELLRRPVEHFDPGFTAQVIGTGPAVRYSAMPEMFAALMGAARSELVISTPYYVPDEPIQAALCASARRGVATTVIFPRRNDSWVGGGQPQLLQDMSRPASIYEYVGGLPHTVADHRWRTFTDRLGERGRRSFELNQKTTSVRRQGTDGGLVRCSRAGRRFRAGQTHAVARRPRDSSERAVAMLGPVLQQDGRRP